MPVTTLVPIFLVAGLGALLVRLHWLRGAWHAGATELTAKVLLPALLFYGAYRTGIPASVSWQVLVAFYAPLAVVWAGARLLAGAGGNAAALAATYSNTSFVGLPVLVQVLGEDSLRFAYPIIAFHSLFCFTVFHLTDSGRPAQWWRPVLGTLSNPIVVSLLSGLALNLAGVHLPAFVVKALDVVSSAALPCALLCLGASLASLQPARWGSTAAIVACKLAVLPLAVLLLSAFVLHLPATAATVLVVMAACPVGVNAAFLVKPGGDSARLVNSAILMSSLACAATIPGWLALLRMFA